MGGATLRIKAYLANLKYFFYRTDSSRKNTQSARFRTPLRIFGHSMLESGHITQKNNLMQMPTILNMSDLVLQRGGFFEARHPSHNQVPG
jgi:hypothetical protein